LENGSCVDRIDAGVQVYISILATRDRLDKTSTLLKYDRSINGADSVTAICVT